MTLLHWCDMSYDDRVKHNRVTKQFNYIPNFKTFLNRSCLQYKIMCSNVRQHNSDHLEITISYLYCHVHVPVNIFMVVPSASEPSTTDTTPSSGDVISVTICSPPTIWTWRMVRVVFTTRVRLLDDVTVRLIDASPNSEWTVRVPSWPASWALIVICVVDAGMSDKPDMLLENWTGVVTLKSVS